MLDFRFRARVCDDVTDRYWIGVLLKFLLLTYMFVCVCFCGVVFSAAYCTLCFQERELAKEWL